MLVTLALRHLRRAGSILSATAHAAAQTPPCFARCDELVRPPKSNPSLYTALDRFLPLRGRNTLSASISQPPTRPRTPARKRTAPHTRGGTSRRTCCALRPRRSRWKSLNTWRHGWRCTASRSVWHSSGRTSSGLPGSAPSKKAQEHLGTPPARRLCPSLCLCLCLRPCPCLSLCLCVRLCCASAPGCPLVGGPKCTGA